MERSQADTSLTHSPPPIHPPPWYFPLLAFSQPCPYPPSALLWLLVPVSSCDLSSVQRHLINHLTFPQVQSSLLRLRPVSCVELQAGGGLCWVVRTHSPSLRPSWWSRSLAGLEAEGGAMAPVLASLDGVPVLGDRLFLERKLFKFSFSSDDLGGTWSTHVELKPCRNLAINGHANWVLRQGMRHIPNRGKTVGYGNSEAWGGGP